MKFLRRFNSSDRDAAIVLALVIIVSIVLFPHLSEQDKGNMSFNSSPNSKLTSSPPNSKLSTLNHQLSARPKGTLVPKVSRIVNYLSLTLTPPQSRSCCHWDSHSGKYATS